MSATPQETANELRDLLRELCEGELDAAGFARIEQLVDNDSTARQRYVNYLWLHGELHWTIGRRLVPESLTTSTECESPASVPDLCATADRAWNEEVKKTHAEVRRAAWYATRPLTGVAHSPRRLQRLWYLTTAGLCGVLVSYFVGMAVFVSLRDRPARELAQDNGSHVSPAAVPVATLTAESDCVWVPNSRAVPHVGQRLSTDETIALRSGIAEVTFADGAVVVLKGPSLFTPKDRGRGLLDRGKLVARVPKRATGFTIATPTVTVVDLGTEFGLIADSSGETEIKVFQGRVSVKPVATSNVPQPKAFVLHTGEMKRVSNDGTVDVANDLTAGTWTLLEQGLSKQRIERQVFPQGLVAYWGFDENDGPILDGYGIGHGEASEEYRVNGLIGRAALQSRGRPGQLAQIYGCEPEGTFSQALSIEAMFVSSWSGKPGDYDYICRKEQGSTVLISFAFKHDEGNVNGPVLAVEIETDGGLQSLELPLDGRAGRPTLASLTNGKPHYAAATFDGAAGEMAIYIDGIQRIRRSITPSQLLSSDERVPARPKVPASRFNDPFAGVLDEIAIYRVALSIREVAQHWKNVSQGHSYFSQP